MKVPVVEKQFLLGWLGEEGPDGDEEVDGERLPEDDIEGDEPSEDSFIFKDLVKPNQKPYRWGFTKHLV